MNGGFPMRMRVLLTPFAKPTSVATLLSLALLPGFAVPQDFTLDWYSIDGGGEIQSETADQQWQLSGTIGQPDGTESLALSGNGWTLTGGFWPVTVDETDVLFRDSFEGEDSTGQ